MGRSKSRNGSSKFEVGAHDIGGDVQIVASDSPGTPANLGVYFADRLMSWLRANDQTLIGTASFAVGGRTVELIGFYK
jgi:hypothetical protein